MRPLLGRKKELADVRRLLQEGHAVTVVGPPGVGKTAFVEAVRAELPEAGGALREADEPLGEPGEHVYRLKPLAEAPAVELYRELSGDTESSYAELAELTLRIGRNPGAIEAAAQS
jgi:ABC-type cobalamin/Fe3+-siderophores transport system ATPase subunit